MKVRDMKKVFAFPFIPFFLLLLWTDIAEPAEWRLDPADFEFSATMTAVLYANGEAVEGEDNLIGAFSGGECRGLASPIRALGTWVFFITLYANTSGELIEFKAYIAAEGAVVDVDETIDFQANSVYGDPTLPFELHAFIERPLPPAVSGVLAETAAGYTRFRLGPGFPNPFNQSTRIRYELPVAGPAELAVYNLLGQKVRLLVSGWQQTGGREVLWDGRDSAGQPVSSGLYLYIMRAGDFRAAQKALLAE